MTEAINSATAQHIASLATAGLKPVKVEKTHHVIVPERFTRVDLTADVEKAEAAPYRKKGTVVLGDVASFLAFAADQDSVKTGYIYADVDSRTLVAIFNDSKAGPGWRDHRATFKAELTPEARRWLEHDGAAKAFTQTEFAEFIEDNFADLQGDDAQNLLTVATTIAATSGINFSSAKRLQDGQTQLVYNEVIDAAAGQNGELKIPKTFTLGLRLFKNGDGYALTARLKYRLHSGNVKFWYELDRPERAVEDAFKGYVAEVSAKSGYTVLTGKA
ncbi:hypothetical protein H4CHR_04431 [Variovorax sp. PBS-H4]|uniref:DUF2303 family protein n=1 Tax=Variovorax sp. PBS-H4 TaxID=434008 RepID=UPI001318960A|nr:DUF2303 family protein [Variovorax sp. PBS-H4]VTU38461.1 hypothetical protein H4CHR_04431 [Variovorax sp. PBS-H4]